MEVVQETITQGAQPALSPYAQCSAIVSESGPYTG